MGGANTLLLESSLSLAAETDIYRRGKGVYCTSDEQEAREPSLSLAAVTDDALTYSLLQPTEKFSPSLS